MCALLQFICISVAVSPAMGDDLGSLLIRRSQTGQTSSSMHEACRCVKHTSQINWRALGSRHGSDGISEPSTYCYGKRLFLSRDMYTKAKTIIHLKSPQLCAIRTCKLVSSSSELCLLNSVPAVPEIDSEHQVGVVRKGYGEFRARCRPCLRVSLLTHPACAREHQVLHAVLPCLRLCGSLTYMQTRR
jgi:hypothetical protein